MQLKKLYSILLILIFIPLTTWGKIIVHIHGVTEDMQKNILENLTVDQLEDIPENNEKIDTAYYIADKQIKKALEPFGYYGIKIKKSLSKADKNTIINFTITLGKPIIVKNNTINIIGPGKNSANINKAKENFIPKINKKLYHPDYIQSKKQLLESAIEQGYIKANFDKSEILVDKQQHSADIQIFFNTGIRYMFGNFTLTGSCLSNKLLNRFIKIKPSDPYLPKCLSKLQMDLNNSDYFESIEILPTIPSDDSNKIPVEIKLVDKPKNLYELGVGYGSDTNLRGFIKWQRRYLNKRGHKLDFLARGSRIKDYMSLGYIIPGKFPSNDSYAAHMTRKRETVAERISISNTATFSQRINRGNWTRFLSLDVTHEHFREGEALAATNSRLIIPKAEIFYRKKDDVFNIQHGLFLHGAIQGTPQAFSTTDFIRGDLAAKWVTPVASNSSLILRGKIGALSTRAFDDIPISLRYFAGGDNSIRGFAYKNIGPKGIDGNGKNIVVGGRYLVEGSVEYNHVIKNNWLWAVFYDAGNASNHFTLRTESGAGIGIKWRSPVGPIKFDIAHPLTRNNDSIRLHIRFGPEF